MGFRSVPYFSGIFKRFQRRSSAFKGDPRGFMNFPEGFNDVPEVFRGVLWVFCGATGDCKTILMILIDFRNVLRDFSSIPRASDFF